MFLKNELVQIYFFLVCRCIYKQPAKIYNKTTKLTKKIQRISFYIKIYNLKH